MITTSQSHTNSTDIHSSDHRHVTFPDQTPCPSSSDDQDDHRPLLLRPSYPRSKSLLSDELRHFRISLKWCALDHSTPFGRSISYIAFLFFAVLVPILASLSYNSSGAQNDDVPLTFNKLVQLPESGLALISFLTLTAFFRRYGLRHLLFLDGLHRDSLLVRRGYSIELHRAFRYLAAILLPSFFLQLAHKIVFFFVSSSAVSLSAPLLPIVFILVMASWVYRTGVFLLVCVLFRLTCELQIMRFQGLQQLFQGREYRGGGEEEEEECAGVIFGEHVRIKKQLRFTSHRYRSFIIACLVAISVSQLGALLLILASHSHKSFLNSGDLVICSAVQLSGLFLCLMGAARITHRAQGIVSLATRWNMIVTNSSAAPTTGKRTKNRTSQDTTTDAAAGDDSDEDTSSSSSSSSTSEVLISVSVHGDHNASSSFQTRQALVAYLQHNNGGITLFGFPLDRGLLHTLFAFEFSLVLWILSKVVVL